MKFGVSRLSKFFVLYFFPLALFGFFASAFEFALALSLQSFWPPKGSERSSENCFRHSSPARPLASSQSNGFNLFPAPPLGTIRD